MESPDMNPNYDQYNVKQFPREYAGNVFRPGFEPSNTPYCPKAPTIWDNLPWWTKEQALFGTFTVGFSCGALMFKAIQLIAG